MALIDAYNKPLTAKQAAHLLRRATFGPTPQQIKDFTGLTATAAVTKLLQVSGADLNPAPPLDPGTNKTYVNLPFDNDAQGTWQSWTKRWWLGLMVNQPANVLEKLVLFWQNHFVVAYNTVNDSRFMYQYNQMLRKNALGNFKAFVIDVTKDASMLRYLNGNQNTKNSPNENYGRELQELFTIGVKKPDGTPNYTEDDIKAAAKVLTGWRDRNYRQDALPTSEFVANNHDTTDKKFSAYYQNTTIKGRTGTTAGDDELKDLVDMILKQTETTRNIVRELYRWYVNFDITADIEKNFIEPLATTFSKDFEIKTVLAAILKSEHFFDEKVRGAIIKSPVELMIGMLRYSGITPPDMATKATEFYSFMQNIQSQGTTMQQDVMNQTTVFGWRPYYDTDFYQLWISSSTLALRGRFSDSMLNGSFRASGKVYAVDTIAIAKLTSDPSDPVKLVDEIAANIMAIDLTQSQKDFLIDQALLPGLPRYEWFPEWQDYIKAPNDKNKMTAVKMKLDTLMQFMFRMAEYQVS